MPSRFGVFVSFSEAEVNDVNHMLLLLHSDQEVVRLNISMKKAILMDILYPLEHLNGKHQNCFQTKLSSAVLE